VRYGQRLRQRHPEAAERKPLHLCLKVREHLNDRHRPIVLRRRRFGDDKTSGGERLRDPIRPGIAATATDDHALPLQRVHAGSEHGMGADHAGARHREHGLHGRLLHAGNIH
jgi:hypothetical protein